jgi:hypothetical protein
MKKLILTGVFMAVIHLLMGQTNPLKLSGLEGEWFVIRSNFPMWLKGNKSNPSLNYSLTMKHGRSVLLDRVIYTKNSKTKSIVGYDKPENADNRSFTWRGKGILCFLKSKWSVLYLDVSGKWMIIHFRKTLFTPEGYDVVSKSKEIGTETENQISKKLEELKIEKLSVIRHIAFD